MSAKHEKTTVAHHRQNNQSRAVNIFSFMAFFKTIALSAALISLITASASAQMCGRWKAGVSVVDKDGKPLKNASVTFIDVPEGDPAFGRAFQTAEDEPANILFAAFNEGEHVAKSYKIAVSAPGFAELFSQLNIDYCRRTVDEVHLQRR